MTNEQDMIDELRSKGYAVRYVADIPHAPQSDYEKLIIQLDNRINKLEARTGLLHPAWFTRAVTAWVYVMGFQLIVGVIILVFVSVIGYLLGN